MKILKNENSIYVQKGWNDIQADYQNYQDFINKARAAGNKQAIAQAVQAWNGFTSTYGIQNPIWYDDYTGKAKVVNAKVALVQLQEMDKKGLLTGPQGSKIADVLVNYNNFNTVLQQQIIGGKKSPMYSTYKNMWYDYLDQLEKSDTQLTTVINSVFRRVTE